MAILFITLVYHKANIDLISLFKARFVHLGGSNSLARWAVAATGSRILRVMRQQRQKRAAGIVITRDAAHGTEVLLLRAYRNWDLPKGRLEDDETPLQGALREVREETGLSVLEFAWGEQSMDTEPYAGGKIVRFFLARTQGAIVSLPINPELGRPEHHEFRWLSFPAALQLTVPRLQRILRWAATETGVVLGPNVS